MRREVTACDRCGDFLDGPRKPTTIEWADRQKPAAHLCDGCRDALAARMALPLKGAATAARDRYQAGINAGRRPGVKVKR